MEHALSVEKNESYGYTVTIDGADISASVHSVNVMCDGDEKPRVEIRPAIRTADIHLDKARVTIPTNVANLLMQLGWTPPNE